MNQESLTRDALAIWQAGVAGVDSLHLVQQNVQVKDDLLHLADKSFRLSSIRRIVVVGAGKAGAGMAAGLELALGDTVMNQKQLTGWLNVPADCVRPLTRITLHAARPAGINEPTVAGVLGAKKILELVGNLGPDDLCICLLSGGGSALMPAPSVGITLDDKLAVTKLLSAAGANIEQLNTVRKQLSQIKGGGLARACRAGHLVTLIISDVMGDPLDIIASGPTVPDTGTAADALAILEHFRAREAGIRSAVFEHLQQADAKSHDHHRQTFRHVANVIIGNNPVAVDAAGMKAESLGYAHAMVSHRQLEGEAEVVGRQLAQTALRMKSEAGPNCLISGGEPTVNLVEASQRGLGGRNQQLALAALCELKSVALTTSSAAIRWPDRLQDLVILSGGTDGEDGPTDAAGAYVNAAIAAEIARRQIDPEDYLRRNDAYRLFEPLEGLIKTGPTHTNVCDLRVVVCRQQLS
jgi:glycerate 2-kinase